MSILNIKTKINNQLIEKNLIEYSKPYTFLKNNYNPIIMRERDDYFLICSIALNILGGKFFFMPCLKNNSWYYYIIFVKIFIWKW
jgi:hypothetical protein